jgi:hypothetical protein
MLERTHLVYQILTRRIIDEDDTGLAQTYNPTLYAEAVKLGERLKTSKNLGQTIKAAAKRMSQWPVFCNVIVCKQVPVKRLAKVIENKTFRPFAEELMTIIFGV